MTTSSRNHAAFPDIAKSQRSNPLRREKIVKNAPAMAKEVAVDMKHELENIFKPLQDKHIPGNFVSAFELVLKKVHGVSTSALLNHNVHPLCPPN